MGLINFLRYLSYNLHLDTVLSLCRSQFELMRVCSFVEDVTTTLHT